MGRDMPTARLSAEVQAEADLAQAVDAAVDRLTVTDAESTDDVLAEAVISELNGSAAGSIGAHEAGPDSAAPVLLNLVGLDGLEVTQEVQDIGHSVPLVAQKTTIVRAYLRFPTAVEVRGELLVSRSANGPWTTVGSIGTAALDPARTGGTLAQLRSRRGNLEFSLNFRLPPGFTTQGRLFLRTGAIRRTTGTALPSIAGISVRSVTFQRAATLRVRLVRMRYSMGAPPRTFAPTDVDATLFGSWLRRAYPTHELFLSTSSATAVPAAPFNASQINAQLIALRAVDVSTGTDARTHYYGMVSDGGFFMRGLASGIPGSPAPGTVASGPTGPGTFGWDTDGSYGDWYGGHELGHTFGRFHAEFCGAAGGAPYPFPNGRLANADEAFVGIDVGDAAVGLPMKLMGGVSSHDMMTYCNNQWLSSFTYSGIYQRLVAENALPAGAGGGAEVLGMAGNDGVEAGGVRVIAAVNLTVAAASITAVIPSAGDAPAEVPVAAGTAGPDGHQLTIRVVGAGGEVLDERTASFRPSSCQDPGQDVTGVLDEVLPVPPGAAAIEVRLDGVAADVRLIGGQVSTSAALQVGLDGLGAEVTPGGGIRLAWDVPDAPAGQRYVVQLSDDAGATWRTVAVDLAEPAVEVSADELTGDAVTARILATTGPASTVVSTDAVTVR